MDISQKAKVLVDALPYIKKYFNKKVDSTYVGVLPSLYSYMPDFDRFIDVQTIDKTKKYEIKQVKAKAPTCTRIGWNAHEICERDGCDYSTKIEKVKHLK